MVKQDKRLAVASFLNTLNWQMAKPFEKIELRKCNCVIPFEQKY
jgi:hypothetical protein